MHELLSTYIFWNLSWFKNVKYGSNFGGFSGFVFSIWLHSCTITIYWIFHLFLTDLRCHLYHILYFHTYLRISDLSILYIDLSVHGQSHVVSIIKLCFYYLLRANCSSLFLFYSYHNYFCLFFQTNFLNECINF